MSNQDRSNPLDIEPDVYAAVTARSQAFDVVDELCAAVTNEQLSPTELEKALVGGTAFMRAFLPPSAFGTDTR